MTDKYLTALLNLFEEFNSSGLNYCHWKSNINLSRSLKGLTDLDLLVERSQVNLFKEIIFRHNIKSISSSRDHNFPAIENYLGIDELTGKLFHLHVHYKLILGEQFIKNYHLPYEDWLMEDCEVSTGNVVIPSPEREFVVLLIRSLLKYRDRDVIKDVFGVKSPGIPIEIRNELQYLFNRTSRGKVLESVNHKPPILSTGLVKSYLDVLESSSRDGWKYYRMREQLRKELRPYRRQDQWKASLEYYRKLWRSESGNAGKKAGKKALSAGGMRFAIIGADGAGKSTLIRELTEWLSWKLSVTNFYMGSQEPSSLSRICNFLAKNVNRVLSLHIRVFGDKGYIYSITKELSSLTRYLYYLSTANDRYRRYRAGQKISMDGGIVVYDRFPLQQIHDLMQENPMDGPRIPYQENRATRLDKKLSKIERSFYKKISPPDIIFALNVTPETSKKRKPDHDLKVIEKKSQVIREFDRNNLNVRELNADEPFDMVSIKTKIALWEYL